MLFIFFAIAYVCVLWSARDTLAGHVNVIVYAFSNGKVLERGTDSSEVFRSIEYIFYMVTWPITLIGLSLFLALKHAISFISNKLRKK